MSIAYVTNRSQIDGANAQAALAARQNQPLEQRLHALSELQKTLARLQYRSEHGVPWYEQAGLSQNNALLAALWPRYQDSALPLLRMRPQTICRLSSVPLMRCRRAARCVSRWQKHL
jgi:type VI secretion system protein ImpL